jgi:hypothetical protein
MNCSTSLEDVFHACYLGRQLALLCSTAARTALLPCVNDGVVQDLSARPGTAVAPLVAS